MIEKISYHLGQKDEMPNIELAQEIVSENGTGISEIVEGLDDSNKNIQADCIKVIYEIGKLKPQLICNYVNKLIMLVKSRNNRIVWGAMMALSQIAPFKAEEIFQSIDVIIKAYETGSVITVDYSITLFAQLVKVGQNYEEKIYPLIIDHLNNCRPKEVPQHAERVFICINKNNSSLFYDVLKKRLHTLSNSQQKRVDRLLKKIENNQFE